jgi:hypothetical protein
MTRLLVLVLNPIGAGVIDLGKCLRVTTGRRSACGSLADQHEFLPKQLHPLQSGNTEPPNWRSYLKLFSLDGKLFAAGTRSPIILTGPGAKFGKSKRVSSSGRRSPKKMTSDIKP